MKKVVDMADRRPYSKATLADLGRSGLYEKDARKMRLVELTREDVKELTKGRFRCTGYKIPYFDRDGNPIDFFRIRFHVSQKGKGKNAAKRKQRYWQSGPGVQVYLAPCVKWDDVYGSCTVAGYITEGEKKAYRACKDSLYTQGLGGVWSFSSKTEAVELHPEVRDFAQGRCVGIVYDAEMRADGSANSDVEKAGRRLAALLVAAKADEVAHIHLPTGYNLDDYLKTHTVEDFYELPYEVHGIKAQLQTVRDNKLLDQRSKFERMLQIMLADMEARGSFHFQQEGTYRLLFWFDKRTCKLYPLDARNSRTTMARMSHLYGISGAEYEWSWLYDGLASHCTNEGVASVIHSLVHGKQDTLYIFNGRDVFKVTPTGYKTVANGTDGVLFHNLDMQRVKLRKYQDDPMRLLVRTPRFVATEFSSVKHLRVIFRLWMWSVLFPHVMPTKAFPLIHGPQGSHKTSAAQRFLQTLYGKEAQVSYLNPKKLDGFVTQLAHQHVVALDNVDGKHEDEVGNLIAIASTGGDYTLRELYTTLEQRKVRLDTFLLITSRDPDLFRKRGDITERLLPLPVTPGERKIAENVIRKRTRINRGCWWQYVLDTLPAMLAALRDAKRIEHNYRMADFADFCFAVAPVLGIKVELVKEALDALEQERAVLGIEMSRLPDALTTLLDTYEFLRNHTARDLLAKLRELDPTFPYENPHSFSKALSAQQKGLLAMGIKVESKSRRDKVLLWSITRQSAGVGGKRSTG